MQKNQIKQSQICAVFIALCPLTKMIALPALCAKTAGEKLWQPPLLLILADLAMLLFLLYINRKRGGKSFFSILSEGYSPAFAKLIMVIYALFFAVKAFLPMAEHKQLIENAFYETMPTTPIFYPAVIAFVYLSLKGFKTVGRLAQILLYVTLLGLGLIFFLSIPTSDYSNLLPLLQGSNKNGAIGALNALSWFNDCAYLLMFMGHFKQERHGNLKLVLSFAAYAVLILLFFFTFYGVFSYIAGTQELALSAISIFSVSLVNVGRFDYVAVFLLSLSGIFAVSLPIVCSVYCLIEAFSLKSSLVAALAVNGILLLAIILLSQKYYAVKDIITTYLTPLFVFCGYGLPLLCLGGKKRVLQAS